MLALVCGLFGLVIGSFLNVVILRFGTRSIGGRSACASCASELAWYDIIPVFSWVVLRGRCRTCHARISLQYPLVEAAVGILFALIAAAALPWLTLLISLPIAALFVCIFVYDLYHALIPDAWVWPLCALSLAVAFVAGSSETSWPFLLLAGPAAALSIFLLWAFSRGAWMGFGDVKLSLGIGWLLGFPAGLLAILLAFVIGAVVSVGILLPLPYYAHALSSVTPTRSSANVSPRFTMKSEVPFGPFLIAATFIVWFALLYNIPLPL